MQKQNRILIMAPIYNIVKLRTVKLIKVFDYIAMHQLKNINVNYSSPQDTQEAPFFCSDTYIHYSSVFRNKIFSAKKKQKSNISKQSEIMRLTKAEKLAKISSIF